jgi:hypothetical protein
MGGVTELALAGRSLTFLWLAVEIGCGGIAIYNSGRLQPAGNLNSGGVLEASRAGVKWRRQ